MTHKVNPASAKINSSLHIILYRRFTSKIIRKRSFLGIFLNLILVTSTSSAAIDNLSKKLGAPESLRYCATAQPDLHSTLPPGGPLISIDQYMREPNRGTSEIYVL